MAARAIIRKVYVKPQAFLPAFLSHGIDDTTIQSLVPISVTKTAKPLVPTSVTKTTIEWRIQKFEEVVQTGLELLQNLQKEGLVEEKLSDSNDMMISSLKTIYALWMKKIEEEQRILLQEGWTCLRDFLRREGLENCHKRLLLSVKPIEPDQSAVISHNHGSGGEGNIIEFATASPEEGLTSLRKLVLRRPGPYELPRQAVDTILCIATKDAFMLYNLTTGDKSPWIETTTTGELCRGKPRRQVESIALGYAPETMQHKVVCISSDVKKRFPPETDVKERLAPADDYLVVEVLTVRGSTWIAGDHNWRRLEDDGLPYAFVAGERFTFVDGPIYLDGQIHWQMHYSRHYQGILVFYVESENFVFIPIPKFLVEEFMDYSRHIWSMLMEVDGKIAILKSASDQETSSLHICHRLSKCGKIKWTEEKILIPYAYVCSASSIEALKETDFIFIQSDRHIFYYNRKTKESLSLRIPTLLISDHFNWGRITQL